ncbi:MAG: GNAT family N-acetyltransferase [Myxococcota bacterium]
MTAELPSNTHCPWSGKPISNDSLTEFEGRTVGFCNPECRDKFEQAVAHFRVAAKERRLPGPARRFRRDDVPQLHGLMCKLAEFEGYIDDFKVSPADLVRFGLCQAPAFHAYVVDADKPGQLAGMTVMYVTQWTYAGSPNLVLKELFVDETYRGRGVGRALMAAVRHEAENLGASRIIWKVLTSNEKAQRFYSSLGAVRDLRWQDWSLTVKQPDFA